MLQRNFANVDWRQLSWPPAKVIVVNHNVEYANAPRGVLRRLGAAGAVNAVDRNRVDRAAVSHAWPWMPPDQSASR